MACKIIWNANFRVCKQFFVEHLTTVRWPLHYNRRAEYLEQRLSGPHSLEYLITDSLESQSQGQSIHLCAASLFISCLPPSLPQPQATFLKNVVIKPSLKKKSFTVLLWTQLFYLVLFVFELSEHGIVLYGNLLGFTYSKVYLSSRYCVSRERFHFGCCIVLQIYHYLSTHSGPKDIWVVSRCFLQWRTMSLWRFLDVIPISECL